MTEPTPATIEGAQDRVQKLVREAFQFCEDQFGEKSTSPGLVLELVRLTLDLHAAESRDQRPDAWSRVLEQFWGQLATMIPGPFSAGPFSAAPAPPIVTEAELEKIEKSLGETPK